MCKAVLYRHFRLKFLFEFIKKAPFWFPICHKKKYLIDCNFRIGGKQKQSKANRVKCLSFLLKPRFYPKIQALRNALFI